MLLKRCSIFLNNYIIKSLVTDSPKSVFKLAGVKKSEKFEYPIYGDRRLVSLIEGTDKELAQYVIDTYKLVEAPIDFEVIEGDDVLDESVLSIQRNGAGIKGNFNNDNASFNLSLRAMLDLYVYCVNYHSYPNIPTKHPKVDIILIRQNTFDWIASLEHQVKNGIIESLKITTMDNVKKFAIWAFKFAKENNRTKITVVYDVHSQDKLPYSVIVYIETIKSVSIDYPEIRIEFVSINKICNKLVVKPVLYDVLLLTNLYGSSVAHIICGLTGSPGLFSGQNYSDNYALFENATQKDQKKIDKNLENPVAMLRASVNLLQFFGLDGRAKLIEDAICTCLIQDNIKTPDIGGNNKTIEVIDNIHNFIKNRIQVYRNFFKF